MRILKTSAYNNTNFKFDVSFSLSWVVDVSKLIIKSHGIWTYIVFCDMSTCFSVESVVSYVLLLITFREWS